MARYPAVRSSMRTCSRIRPARSASCNANASGALRDPGHSTTSRTPPRINSSTTTRACAVDGFTTTACHTASVRLWTLVLTGQPLEFCRLRLGNPRLALDVDGVGQDPVQDSGARTADEHREVAPVELARHKPGVLAGGQERKHRRKTHEIGRDAAPTPPSVHATRVEYLGDGVVPASHDVVVDEVDRGPRDEQVEHQQEEVLEVGEEVLADEQRRDQGEHRGEGDGEDPHHGRRLDLLERVDRAEQSERSAVHVQGGYRNEAERGEDEGNGPEA